MAANASILFFVPGLESFLGLFGTPFLWATYYALIPQIVSRWKRFTTVVLIASLHLMLGVWVAREERQFYQEKIPFARAFDLDSSVVISWGVLLISAFVCLAFLTSEERDARKQI